MKKEDIEGFKGREPFLIFTKYKSIYTVREVKKLTDSSVTFIDKFNGLNVIDLKDISEIKDISNNKGVKSNV
jgi:hypothetical protein